MFEKSHDTDEKIAAVITLLATYKRGDIIPHHEIAQVTGLVHGTPRYYSLVRRARDLYRDTSGVWTRECKPVGYRLLTPEQSLIEEQSDRRRRSRKQLKIASSAAATIADEELSDHQKRLRAHILESHWRARKELLEDEQHEAWLLRNHLNKRITIRPPRTGTNRD